MVLVAADTCSDCTAVVNAVQVRILFHNGEGDDDDHCSAVDPPSQKFKKIKSKIKGTTQSYQIKITEDMSS